MREKKTTEKKTSDPLIVQSVSKAFRVLNAFNHERPRLSLAQISAIIGCDKSTAQRFTHTLVHLGYLTKNADRSVSLSARNLVIAHSFLRTSPIVSAAMPYLIHLHQETRETVNLTVLEGTDSVFVMRLVGSHIFASDVIIGSTIPAYCSASGLAILANLPPEETDAILKASDLKPLTPNTVWKIGEIRSRLAHTREQGYITTHDEYRIGDVSIGAPILDRSGRPLAAISVAVSRARFTPDEADKRFSSLVIAASRSIVL